MRGHASIDELSGYLDGELSATELHRVESHVARCAACRHRVDELASLVADLQRLPRLPPPAALREGLGLRLARETGRRSWLDRLEEAIPGAAARSRIFSVAAVVLALAIFTYLLALLPWPRGPAGRGVESTPAGGVVAVVTIDDAARRFVHRGGTWIEQGSALEGGPAARIDPRDELGERWLSDHPQLAPLARLGGPVELELEGRWVRIDFPPAATPRPPGQE